MVLVIDWLVLVVSDKQRNPQTWLPMSFYAISFGMQKQQLCCPFAFFEGSKRHVDIPWTLRTTKTKLHLNIHNGCPHVWDDDLGVNKQVDKARWWGAMASRERRQVYWFAALVHPTSYTASSRSITHKVVPPRHSIVVGL